jgi:hypothetical protein
MPFDSVKTWLRAIFVVCVIGWSVEAWAADEKKPAQPPRVATLSPLSLISERTNTLSIRGFNLKDATEVRLSLGASNVPVRILDRKDAGAIKGLDAKDTGEHWITAEVFLPATLGSSSNVMASVVVKAPSGETSPVARPVISTVNRLKEREPNGGFKTAHLLEFDSHIVVTASIQPEHDVDVYGVLGRKGQILSVRLRNAAFGSFLDPIITVYNDRGGVVAVLDDTGPKHEFETTVPWREDGRLFLVVQDANEHASDWHGYELELNRN